MNKQIAAFFLSFVCVAFGQPAWISAFGVISAFGGFALFWWGLLQVEGRKRRFWYGTAWFALVQMVQLSWLISHPYAYIYIVWPLLSFALGLQFGFLSLLFPKEKDLSFVEVFGIAATWTLLEWGRLFLFSGYTWNPIGLSLASTIVGLQFASLVGAYGLTFWVAVTNLLLLRAWLRSSWKTVGVTGAVMACIPYLFGVAHLQYHDHGMKAAVAKGEERTLAVNLIQTAFPVEESMEFKSHQEFLEYVKREWRTILRLANKHEGKATDLLVLPEFVVPYGTYSFVFPFEEVKALFVEEFGLDVEKKLPELKLPLAVQYQGEWKVCNAYWCQALADLFDADVIAGLEDAEDVCGEREYYSSAIHFTPKKTPFSATRYAKRVLVPMGEYIPFSFCRDLAAQYGVTGSFTCGQEAVAWKCGKTSVSPSICYEETFGHLMREGKLAGAEVFLNLSSDAWFPHSRLIRQHLEHARLRAVENGVPLVRSGNTGITCVVDAAGRDLEVLGESDEEREDLADSLHVNVPIYHYSTLYSLFGDGLAVGSSLVAAFFFFVRRQV